MSIIAIQRLLASVFIVLGGWCLLAPQSVLHLTVTPAYQSDDRIVSILMGAFGAQALIASLFALTARFTSTTFLAYGLSLFPFFVFDYWFFAVEPMLTPLGMLDAVGNVIMLALCWLGWRAARANEANGAGSVRVAA